MPIVTILNSLFVVFALAIPGVIFKKIGKAEKSQLKTMSGFMIDVILPAIIIYSMQTEFSKEVLENAIKVFAAVFILFGALIVVSFFLTRGLKLEKKYTGLVSFIMFFANTGGIGIPVVNMLFGSEAVFYASAAEMATDILIFTAGVMLMKSSGNNEGGIDFKAFLSPGTFSIIIGMILFLTGIRLPVPVNNVLSKLTDASLAVTMFVIGAQIAGINIQKLERKGKLLIITAAKLLAAPFVMFVISKYVLGCDNLIVSVLTLLYAMPTGGAVAIFAQQYGADSEFAAASVFLTDVLCIISIPIILILI